MSQQINLYHPIFRKQQKKFSAKTMLQAVAVIVGALMLIGGYSTYRIGILKKELHQAGIQNTAVLRRLEQLTRNASGKTINQKIDDEIQRLEREIAASTQIQAILKQGVFTNTQGFSRYFVALAKGNIKGLWLTHIEITGAATAVTLEGMSNAPYLVPRYLQRLSGQEELTDIEFRAFEVVQPKSDDGGKSNTNSRVMAFRVATDSVNGGQNDRN